MRSNEAAKNLAEKPRLTAAESQLAIQQMAESAKAPPDAKNRRLRADYIDKSVVIETEEGAGRKLRQVMQGRNLSSLGLAAIHSQFVHSGRACTIYLASLDSGAPVAIPAKIGRCRFVSGRVHEVVIKFDSAIDLRQFVKLNAADTRRYVAERKADKLEDSVELDSEPGRASGNALVIEDFESSRQLFAMWLTKLGLNVQQADTAAAADALIGKQSFDLIVVDAALAGESEGLALIRKLRGKKLSTPVICVGADSNQDSRGLAMAAGASDFLAKPFEKEDLHHAVVQLLRSDPYGPLQTAPIRSTLTGDADAAPLLEKFVDQIRTLADMLRSVANSGDVPGTVKICRRLVEGGKGYGLNPVSEVGSSVLANVQKDPSNVVRLRKDVDRLIHVLNRVQT
ncbi:MAG TPA: response regulator [Tepidisphaeraceae bacterium]|nr:response regulator [Tepidisphaeraceae bacterium]